MKKIKSLITFLFIVSVTFSATLSFAATRPADVYVSDEYGTVKEVYDAGEGSPLIIHIQSAHCNYGAQKNIANMMEGFINNYGINLFLVEAGAAGKQYDLSYLHSYADLEAREKVAEEYLRKGVLSADEYLSLKSDAEMSIYGIEKMPLYVTGTKQFLEISEKIAPQALPYIDKLRTMINALKTRIYTPELIEYDNNKEKYNKEELELVQYHRYLISKLKEKNLPTTDFPNIERFLKANKIESQIDFDKVNDERTELIDGLTEKLTEKDMDLLVEKTMDFKQGKIKAGQYYQGLNNLKQKVPASPAGREDLDLATPNLKLYTEYISIYDTIDTSELFREETALEDVVAENLCVTDEQKLLTVMAKNINLLKDFFKIKLSPDEYNYYLSHKDGFITAKWIKFLMNQAFKYNISLPLPNDSAPVDVNITKMEKFYDNANRRDIAMVDNADTEMKQQKKDTAVLIAGGFHTPRITKLFKAKGYSYVVVAPKVEQATDDNLYKSVVKEMYTSNAHTYQQYLNTTTQHPVPVYIGNN